MLEAKCSVCGETFNPRDVFDIIHIAKENGDECGGEGIILGEWIIGRGDTQ